MKESTRNTKLLNANLFKNKCCHIGGLQLSSDNQHVCISCGSHIKSHMDIKELQKASKIIIDYLETMKLIMYYSHPTKKELRVANKYFKTVPYLKNIDALYNICQDKLKNIESLQQTDEDPKYEWEVG